MSPNPHTLALPESRSSHFGVGWLQIWAKLASEGSFSAFWGSGHWYGQNWPWGGVGWGGTKPQSTVAAKSQSNSEKSQQSCILNVYSGCPLNTESRSKVRAITPDTLTIHGARWVFCYPLFFLLAPQLSRPSPPKATQIDTE